jgi:hypothetical protein
MVLKMARDEAVPLDRVTYLKRRRMALSDRLSNMLRDTCHRMTRNDRLKVVFPYRVSISIPVWRPIAGLRSKIHNWDASLVNRPRYVRNDLLDEREEPCISLTDNVKSASGRLRGLSV